jgi:ATP-binding cassette subfamily C (CFTR/MRP) protein 4
MLQTKVRVLVTHQLQFLPRADKIILLKDGCIQTQGTYSQLVQEGVDFSQYVTISGETEENPMMPKRPNPSLKKPGHRARSRTESVCSTSSYSSIGSTGRDYHGEEEEELVKGTVNWGVYFRYFSIGGTYLGELHD